MPSPRNRLSLLTPSIFRAGLLLVLVPCVLGSIFLVALNQLWVSTGELSAREHTQTETVLDLTEAFRGLVAYFHNQMTFTFESTASAGKRATVERCLLLRGVQKLRKYPGQDSQQLTNLQKTSELFCRVISETEELTPSLDASQFSNNVHRFASFKRIMRTGLILSDQIQACVERQSRNQNRDRTKLDYLGKSLRYMVLFGFAGTMSVSVLLLIGFIRDVLIRLEQLAVNARALSTYGWALSELQGNDELAYLDSVFHDVADELRSAREQHNLIMQMVAHDIRSPIMATQIYVEVLQELLGANLSATASKSCQTLKESSDRVLSFVTELLTLERIESGNINLQYSHFGLVRLVEDCIASLAVLAERKNIVLISDCQDCNLLADRARVVHVLMNYLSNAIKFSPAGEPIRVSARLDDERFITVLVDDNGPGIPEAMRGQVFDKFYRGPNEVQGGFGLGLSICKMLIESHKGQIGVNSVPGKGSQFWFTLPKVTMAPELIAETDAGFVDAAANKARKNRQALRGLLRPGLARQGLIVMLLPFVAQTAWLFWINEQVSTADRLEKLECKQADFVVGINRLWLFSFESSTGLAFYILHPEQRYWELCQTGFKQLDQAVAMLDSSAADDPATLKAWLATRSFVLEEQSKQHKILDSRSCRSASADLGRVSDAFIRFEKLVNRIEELQKQQLSKLSKTREQQRTLLRVVPICICATIGLNLVLYFVLWVLFANRFLKRLDRLVRCAKQLPGRQVKLAVSRSNDELSLLGAQLQKACIDLTNADEQRRSLMNMVAHDIRSPLMAMEVSIAILERIDKGLPDSAELVATSLHSIRANIERVLALANDLLTLDKLEEGKIELELCECALTRLIGDAILSITALGQAKGIVISSNCVEAKLFIDRVRITQVLVNLLSNAIKFSVVNSVIEVRGESRPDGVFISVKDCGPGMNSETAARVFDKFFKAANQKEASFGLGLAICRLIIDSHGAQIGVETSPGKGSTFWIILPLHNKCLLSD